MDLHGKNFIGGNLSAKGTVDFMAINPVTGEKLTASFREAVSAEIDEAARVASTAYEEYRSLPAERIAGFLDRVAEEIVALGPELIARAQAETALPEARLTGERGRTVNQLKMFADLVREGSWVDACIDRAVPDRKPLPKPDLRRMLIPIGPVAVFGASNFPLAFSVAGGDTASALAAGNPVVVKAHPAHPGTSELVARSIRTAIDKTGLPSGIFSMVQGAGHEVGLHLVRHEATRAVAFTGSLKGGKALFDAAAARPAPIPVYAEMGSTNPVFVLPGALKTRAAEIAEGLIQSVTLGVGQFCTNPGLVFGLQGEHLAAFTEKAAQLVAAFAPGTMLYEAIWNRFRQGAEEVQGTPGVRVTAQSATKGKPGQAQAMLFATDAKTFLRERELSEELFGPSTLVVSCGAADELERVARELPGQLTATIHGTEEDLEQNKNLVAILREKAGRLVFNGFPTGVEVCPSMHHGGPWPATTDAHFTSVGTAAIKRFSRPVCFQNFPDASLPIELQNKNGRKLWRLVDGQLTKADL
jgi:NADP-dependent aldehyde dehydrogenase